LIFRVLGSGTTLPDGVRGPAGFVVEHGETRLLVDGGSGTLQRLERAGVSLLALDGGVYSHRHLDHCADLGPLLFTLKVLPRARDYPLWGGSGLQAHLDGLRALHGRNLISSRWGVPVTELPLDGPGRADLPGGLSLETRPANHSAGAVHLRFTAPDGATVVFSGDTGPSAALAELAAGADLLVCECALSAENPEIKHLWPQAVADVVSVARPRRVALTHFYPEVDEVTALAVVRASGVPVERAQDGQVFTVGG
jgi:ribonuclease BN (tRNA processing enzyme)